MKTRLFFTLNKGQVQQQHLLLPISTLDVTLPWQETSNLHGGYENASLWQHFIQHKIPEYMAKIAR